MQPNTEQTNMMVLPNADQRAYHSNIPNLFGNLKQWSREYQKKQPFSHIVIDDFLKPESLRAVIDGFPTHQQPIWTYKHVGTSRKHHCSIEDHMPLVIRDVMRELNSQRFIAWLELLTGIQGLLPDPLLFGGGMFAIERGGYLKVHIDFNKHPHNHLDRRLNLLLYLNENWEESYGGCLELWRKDGKGPEVSILPIANRCAIFSTTETSYHGHPIPLNCPEGRTRNCLSLYYYTQGRPETETAPTHSTVYIDTPGS